MIPTNHDVKRFDSICWLAFLGLWITAAIHAITKYPLIGLSDVFEFIPRAESLSLTNLSGWVNGFCPLGFPVLPRIAFKLLGGYEIAGRAICMVSAIICIFTVKALGEKLFSPRVGLIASIACAVNPLFFCYAINSGTDMAATSVMGLSLLAMTKCVDSKDFNQQQVFISGLVLGIACLIRYTSMALLAAYVIWLIIMPVSQGVQATIKLKLMLVGILLAGFF